MGRIGNNLKTMPETKAWAGPAHDAATGMFDRANKMATAFSDYTTAVGNALNEGAAAIGAARKALLDKADEIDRGPLNVSEGWVVLIDPGSQTAEQITELMNQVATEQAAVNALLVAVGDADTSTADNVMAAAKPFGFVPPTPSGLPGMMIPGAQRPADDVPNPQDPLGLMQQATVRGEEMATTVRETTSRYNEEGHYEKTLIMQDGSKHVITEITPNPQTQPNLRHDRHRGSLRRKRQPDLVDQLDAHARRLQEDDHELGGRDAIRHRRNTGGRTQWGIHIA